MSGYRYLGALVVIVIIIILAVTFPILLEVVGGTIGGLAVLVGIYFLVKYLRERRLNQPRLRPVQPPATLRTLARTAAAVIPRSQRVLFWRTDVETGRRAEQPIPVPVRQPPRGGFVAVEALGEIARPEEAHVRTWFWQRR